MFRSRSSVAAVSPPTAPGYGAVALVTTPPPAVRHPGAVALTSIGEQSALMILSALPPVHTGPQAQGDLTVWPWSHLVKPAVRMYQAACAGQVDKRGLLVYPSHRLVTEVPKRPVYWSWWQGNGTLGTLVVPVASVALLLHEPDDPECHGTLRIGPGVYAVRASRHWDSITRTARHEPD